MNRLTALGLASLVAYGLLVASKYAGFVPVSAGDKGARSVALSAANDLPGEISVKPPRAEPNPRVSFPTPPQMETYRPSQVALEFRSARDLKAYADSLALRRASLSGDERYHLAKALEECLFATSINEDLGAYSAKQRRQFLSSLPAGDATNAKRIAAYDAVDNTQRCLRFQGTQISQKEIDELFQASAQQGDARAQARLLVADLSKNNANAPTRPEPTTNTREPNDDLSRMIGLLESRDPEAMLIVGQYLSSSAVSSNLRIGPNGETPEPSAFLGAFSLVACDLGPECISLNRETLHACAQTGYCNAQSFEELYQNFLASPWAYSQAVRYRGIIHNAIDSRNWALIGLIPPVSLQGGAQDKRYLSRF
jgi:hypothetical protein